jgi:hypothetical protein
MSINQLYHTWLNNIIQLYPNQPITWLRNMAWLMAGIFQSKYVALSKVANKIPGSGTMNSITRRLDRFLENPAIRIRDWYASIVKQFLVQMQGQEYRLIVDGSKVVFEHQLLVITLAYHKRAIPLVWTWVGSSSGHSTYGRQLALLKYLHSLLPSGAARVVQKACA